MRKIHVLTLIIIGILSCILPYPVHASDNVLLNKTLNENWQFYERQLLTAPSTTATAQVDLPIEFQEITGEISTYGTFIKQITIPESNIGQLLGLEIPFVYGAIKIYANGELLTEVGQVGKTPAQHETNLKPILLPVTFDQQEVTLAVQLSSFEHIRGGFSGGFKLGEWQQMSERYHFERLVVSFVASIILVAGILALLIGILTKGERFLFTFGFFSIVIAIRAVFAVPFVYQDLPFAISYVWGTKMEYMTTNIAFLLYVWCIYLLFKELVSKVIIYGSVFILAALALLALTTEPIIFQALFFRTSFLMLAFVVYSVIIIIVALKRKMEMAKPLFVGILFVFTGLIVDLLSGLGVINVPPMSNFTIAGNVMIILFFIGNRYAYQLKEVTKLNRELIYMNKTLDEKVRQRTKELSNVNTRLKQLALRDGLTGIFNRHTFDERLKKEFAQAVQYEHDLSLLIMDVDEFKKYNDFYGHVQGDQLLKDLVALIERHLSEDVLFARYGGEEFAFILPNYSKEQAWQIAESIRLLVKEAAIEHLGREEGIVTISLGGAELLTDSPYNPMRLVEIADQRLYRSKECGRDQITFDQISKSFNV